MFKLSLIRCSVIFLLVKSSHVTDILPCKLDEDTKGNCNCVNKQATCYNLEDGPMLPDHIETLNAGSNNILELTAASFSHSNYKQIYLGNNKIYRIDNNAFYDLKKLKVLDLSNNNLQALDKNTFKNNLRLKVLNLHGNLILHFPLHYLPKSLEILDLSNTSSVATTTTFENLSSLRSYKGNLLHNNATDTIKLEINLLQHITYTTKRHNLVLTEEHKETMVKNCSDYQLVGTDTSSTNEAIFDALETLEKNIKDIAVRISNLENIVHNFVKQFDKSNADYRNKIDNDIHLIQIDYNYITTTLNKMMEHTKGDGEVEAEASGQIMFYLTIMMFITSIIQIVQIGLQFRNLFKA